MEASLLTILKGVPFLLKFFFKEDYQATGVAKSQSFARFICEILPLGSYKNSGSTTQTSQVLGLRNLGSHGDDVFGWPPHF